MAKVPDELAELKNWVAYERQHNADHEEPANFRLISPITRHEAKCDDASTWGDYQAAEALSRGLADGGVCFMFGERGKPSGIAAINLRDCFVACDDDTFNWGTGETTLKPYAAEIVNYVNSYTEFMPNQGGLRIIFRLSQSLHEINASFGASIRNSAIGLSA